MAKTEETEGKDVSKEKRKPSEEEALRERIGGAKEGKKAAVESAASGGNEMAAETPVSEGMTKVEKFKAFLEENDLSFLTSRSPLMMHTIRHASTRASRRRGRSCRWRSLSMTVSLRSSAQT